MRGLFSFFLVSLVACASAQNDGPEPGAAGASGTSAGQPGDPGGAAGVGASGGKGPGGSGGQGGSGNAGGQSGHAGQAAGSGGSDAGGTGGDAGGTAGSESGAGGAGKSGAAGKAQAGMSGGSGQSGAAGAMSGGSGASGTASGSGGSVNPFGGGGSMKTCPKDSGSGGSSGTGGGKGIAGGYCAADALGNANDDPCYSCWNDARTGGCKDAFAACEGSPDCLAFFACWSTCAKDEDSCFSKCQASQTPAGSEGFADVRNCVYLSACPQQCLEQCNGIGSANRCNHTVCNTGYDLDPDCSPCAAKVCDTDPVCCDIGWDGSCRSKAEKVCGLDCTEPLPGCVHSECATGAPLDAACSACATKVCQANPLCCQPFGKWALSCAEAADKLCTP